MKKTYIRPSVISYNVDVENMIALSKNTTTKVTSSNKNDFQQLGRDYKMEDYSGKENNNGGDGLGSWDSGW